MGNENEKWLKKLKGILFKPHTNRMAFIPRVTSVFVDPSFQANDSFMEEFHL